MLNRQGNHIKDVHASRKNERFKQRKHGCLFNRGLTTYIVCSDALNVVIDEPFECHDSRLSVDLGHFFLAGELLILD